jgi:hypothetical protein
MPTTRRYTFAHTGLLLQEFGHLHVAEAMAAAEERFWWYRESEVQGVALGTLSFSVVVTAKDQWRCHQRAMWLARNIYRRLKLPLRTIPEPVWYTLTPHTHRGRYRIPKEPAAAS